MRSYLTPRELNASCIHCTNFRTAITCTIVILFFTSAVAHVYVIWRRAPEMSAPSSQISNSEQGCVGFGEGSASTASRSALSPLSSSWYLRRCEYRFRMSFSLSSTLANLASNPRFWQIASFVLNETKIPSKRSSVLVTRAAQIFRNSSMTKCARKTTVASSSALIIVL